MQKDPVHIHAPVRMSMTPMPMPIMGMVMLLSLCAVTSVRVVVPVSVSMRMIAIASLGRRDIFGHLAALAITVVVLVRVIMLVLATNVAVRIRHRRRSRALTLFLYRVLRSLSVRDRPRRRRRLARLRRRRSAQRRQPGLGPTCKLAPTLRLAPADTARPSMVRRWRHGPVEARTNGVVVYVGGPAEAVLVSRFYDLRAGLSRVLVQGRHRVGARAVVRGVLAGRFDGARLFVGGEGDGAVRVAAVRVPVVCEHQILHDELAP